MQDLSERANIMIDNDVKVTDDVEDIFKNRGHVIFFHPWPNQKVGHWVCMVRNKKTGQVYYYDSLGEPPYNKNIVEVAAREGVDMIVMSTHGRTGLDHFLLGSVAEKVLARAPCPVLILSQRAGEGVTVRAKIPNIETVFASG